ncbi:Trp biosynthesis-associated membrane protein [Agromyces sp. Marseille-P2726]|uniref:Trp biosynthesis-associated membrane protein n=1 Tax=Agromyces sp. Marseille-P2726 TaxID=2709132 RepID=UPI001570C7AC|nr:Trp biosynthesis-associated membrane protein [Agromyces sp. Marseille-P2726]
MKLPVILVSVVGSALVLLSWSQTWFDLELTDAAAHGAGETIAVPGSIASPALAALALAGFALVAALAIAGPGIRLMLGILEVVLGGCILLAASMSLGNPVGAVSPAVTEATGVSGSVPTAELVAAADATAWPGAALVGGALVVLAGVAVLVTGMRWPASARRYRGARLADADDAADAAGADRAASDRAIDDWDDLSRGDDPTEQADETAGAGGDDPAPGEGTSSPNR